MSDEIHEWRFHIDDMIRFADNVTAYTADFAQGDVVASQLHYDATILNVELICDAPHD